MTNVSIPFKTALWTILVPACIALAGWKCSKTEVRLQGNYGVVRYELSKRQCSPYFLQRENGAWKLDLTMMSDAIRFNHKNQWHFAMNVDHPYGFAFSDWRFDQHGFPRLR